MGNRCVAFLSSIAMGLFSFSGARMRLSDSAITNNLGVFSIKLSIKFSGAFVSEHPEKNKTVGQSEAL